MGLLNIIFGQSNNQKNIKVDTNLKTTNFKYADDKKINKYAPLKAECIYCYKPLKKIPGSKTKCPHCGEFIYVRTRPMIKERVLVKEIQLTQLEQEWQEHFAIRDFREHIKSHCKNFDKKYSAIKDDLIKKFRAEPSEGDVLWALSMELLLKFMENSNFEDMKMIYFDQALFLYAQGKDYIRVLAEANKCDLYHYRKQKIVKKVEIVTCGDASCPSCQKLSGKIYTIDQALKEMPIPEKTCSHEVNPKSKQG